MSAGYHERALMCVNGHVVTMILSLASELGSPFCSDCGAKTISTCPDCQAPIRGEYMVPGVVSFADEEEAPAFCHACGKPYPWTRDRLAAAQEMARELESLDPEERELLASSLADIMVDGPRTQLAASRTKRLLAKAGTPGKALYQFVMDFGAKVAAEIILSQT